MTWGLHQFVFNIISIKVYITFFYFVKAHLFSMVSIIELIGLNHSNPELLNLRILQPYFVKFLPAEVKIHHLIHFIVNDKLFLLANCLLRLSNRREKWLLKELLPNIPCTLLIPPWPCGPARNWNNAALITWPFCHILHPRMRQINAVWPQHHCSDIKLVF